MIDKHFYDILRGVDLNTNQLMGNPFGTDISGGAYVYRQNPVCPDYGFSSLEHISSYCRSLWRRPSYSHVPLHGAVSHPGIRPVDVSGESSRYRGMPVGPGVEALP